MCKDVRPSISSTLLYAVLGKPVKCLECNVKYLLASATIPKPVEGSGTFWRLPDASLAGFLSLPTTRRRRRRRRRCARPSRGGWHTWSKAKKFVLHCSKEKRKLGE